MKSKGERERMRMAVGITRLVIMVKSIAAEACKLWRCRPMTRQDKMYRLYIQEIKIFMYQSLGVSKGSDVQIPGRFRIWAPRW